MDKGIIILIIYVGWRIFKFYQKSMAENQSKTSSKPQRNSKPKGKSIFDELLQEIEKSKKNVYEDNSYTPSPEETSKKKKQSNSSKKNKEWEFGKDELRTSKEAHERHKTEFKPSYLEEDNSIADEIAEDFDLKKAIVYSEIMHAPYVER